MFNSQLEATVHSSLRSIWRHLTDCNAVKTCWSVLWRRAAAGPVPSLCCSHYTGCQSASASDTKSPLWRSRLIGCHHCRTLAVRSLLNDHISSRMLRPSSTLRLIVPRTRTALAKRVFCVAAPSLWNSLPVDVVDTNTVLTFEKH